MNHRETKSGSVVHCHLGLQKIMIKKHDLHFEKKTPIPPKHLHGEFGALQMSSNISGTSVCSGSLPIYQEMHVSCSSATSIKSK
jgi:hypothetical protein